MLERVVWEREDSLLRRGGLIEARTHRWVGDRVYVRSCGALEEYGGDGEHSRLLKLVNSSVS